MKTIFLKIFFALSIILATTACNSDKTTYTEESYICFATLTELTDSGCTFTVQENNESPEGTLVANMSLDKNLYKEGDRYVIVYTTGGRPAYSSGNINLLQILSAVTGNIQEVPSEDIAQLTADPINVEYSEQVGKWLNIRALAPYLSTIKNCGLYVDESTLKKQYPDVYLGFKSDNTGSLNYRTVYASFDVTSLFGLSGVHGFTFHYINNGKWQTKRFMKSVKEITPAK